MNKKATFLIMGIVFPVLVGILLWAITFSIQVTTKLDDIYYEVVDRCAIDPRYSDVELGCYEIDDEIYKIDYIVRDYNTASKQVRVVGKLFTKIWYRDIYKVWDYKEFEKLLKSKQIRKLEEMDYE